jgi:hypothetical protein
MSQKRWHTLRLRKIETRMRQFWRDELGRARTYQQYATVTNRPRPGRSGNGPGAHAFRHARRDPRGAGGDLSTGVVEPPGFFPERRGEPRGALSRLPPGSGGARPHMSDGFAREAFIAHNQQMAEGGLQLTDLGNAERMIQDYGEELRYCANWKQWLIWGRCPLANRPDPRGLPLREAHRPEHVPDRRLPLERSGATPPRGPRPPQRERQPPAGDGRGCRVGPGDRRHTPTQWTPTSGC